VPQKWGVGFEPVAKPTSVERALVIGRDWESEHALQAKISANPGRPKIEHLVRLT
jgi:hypothetical protein